MVSYSVSAFALDKKICLLYTSPKGEESLILGADTVVVYDGQILGKPKDEAEAVQMLTKLSGHTHSVYTGVAIIDPSAGQICSFYEETRVTMYPMSQAEIQAYVKTGKPMDKAEGHMGNTESPRYYWEGKAGGYGIQDPFGMRYIARIEGNYYNVVGLPVSRLCQELKKLGIEIYGKSYYDED